jgi:hypothetical protein
MVTRIDGNNSFAIRHSLGSCIHRAALKRCRVQSAEYVLAGSDRGESAIWQIVAILVVGCAHPVCRCPSAVMHCGVWICLQNEIAAKLGDCVALSLVRLWGHSRPWTQTLLGRYCCCCCSHCFCCAPPLAADHGVPWSIIYFGIATRPILCCLFWLCSAAGEGNKHCSLRTN